MELNQNQIQAITGNLNPTIVIAGPGSGKTQVLVNRIHYMIKHLNCQPNHILVVTFSKLAAEEMKERFIRLFGEYAVTFGTLHSIFYRILRQVQPSRYALDRLLYDDKRNTILRQLLKELDDNEGEEFLAHFIKHISLMKNQLISPNDYEPTEITKTLFLELLNQYEAYKEHEGLFDFDDMLVECYYLLKNNPDLCTALGNRYRYILVDEFQDINLVQFEVLKLIVQKHQHLFVVGDDDQSIYRFRGAKPEYLLEFTKYFDHVNTFYLNINYRCSGAILKDALKLINQNKVRYHKELTTPNALGESPQIIPCEDQKAEALHIIHEVSKCREQGVALKDIAIIYRTNIQARVVVDLLLDAGIPFYLRDGLFSLYDQWITKDILSYLYLAQDSHTTENAYRILNKPKRYISRATMNQARKSQEPFLQMLFQLNITEWQKNYVRELIYHLQVLKKKPLSEAIDYIKYTIGYVHYLKEYAAYRKMPVQSLFDILDDIEDSAKDYQTVEDWEANLIYTTEQLKASAKTSHSDVITLTTMHGAKGLEFHTVFILDVVEGTVPHFKSKSEQELEEERRLLYVSMTRAKQKLFIYVPKQKYGKKIVPSSFITIFSAAKIANKPKEQQSKQMLPSNKQVRWKRLKEALKKENALSKLSHNEK